VGATKKWHYEEMRCGKALRGFWWCEIRGSRPGPKLAVIAGQHGMEPTGPAVLANLLHELNPSRIRGTLCAIPLANVEALRCGFECEIPRRELARALKLSMKPGHCPLGLKRNTCGRNLNRLWPGNRRGSIHERLVAAMWEHVAVDADCVIDMHCWQDWGPPGAIFYDEASLTAARHFHIPYLHRYPQSDPPGILTLCAGMLSGTGGQSSISKGQSALQFIRAERLPPA